MKRHKYETFLKSVQILSTMDDYESSVVGEDVYLEKESLSYVKKKSEISSILLRKEKQLLLELKTMVRPLFLQ